MKKIILIAAVLFSSLLYKTANAQVSLSLGVNIGAQPDWGPTGYDYVNYYYMPDIDTYYDVPSHQYVYLNNNVWVRSRALPPRYSTYNIYNGYKVVVNEREPWRRADVIRTRYINYRGRHDQIIIRNSRDVKYKEHWKGNNGRGPGNRPDPGHGRGPGPDRGPDHGPGRGPDHGPGRGPGGDHGPGGGHGHGKH